VAQVDGVPLSAGARATLVQRVNTRRDDRVAESLTRVRRSRLLGRDEPGARVNGRPPGEWGVQHPAVWVQGIRPSRGQGVIHDVLGAHRPTVWGAALSRAHKQHPAADWPVCLAHHRRDGPCALEAGDTVFAPRMQAVLLGAFARHTRRDTLATSTRSQYRGDLQRRVDRGLASQPTNAHGRRLQKRAAQIQDPWFLLLADGTIPPTHNASEQAIRLSPVLRKVTHRVRAAWGGDLLAAVRAVVKTGKRHGLTAFQAIQKALAPMGSLFEPG
jgi:transposase